MAVGLKTVLIYQQELVYRRDKLFSVFSIQKYSRFDKHIYATVFSIQSFNVGYHECECFDVFMSRDDRSNNMVHVINKLTIVRCNLFTYSARVKARTADGIVRV